MPVKSLNSSVLVWPDAETVDRAVREWVRETLQSSPAVRRAGYFGSYARGDWGVGSDLDLVIIVDGTQEPFERRAALWDTASLPVPVDVIVYTEKEWHTLRYQRRFVKGLSEEVIWLYDRSSRPLTSDL